MRNGFSRASTNRVPQCATPRMDAAATRARLAATTTTTTTSRAGVSLSLGRGRVARTTRGTAAAATDDIRWVVVRERAERATRAILARNADAGKVLRKALRSGSRTTSDGFTNDERRAIATVVLGTEVWRLRLRAETRGPRARAALGTFGDDDEAERLVLCYWCRERGAVGGTTPSVETLRETYREEGDGVDVDALRDAVDERHVSWTVDGGDAVAVSERCSIPVRTAEMFVREYGVDEAMRLASAMNVPGPMTCRANRALGATCKEDAIAALEKEGVPRESIESRTSANLAPWAFVLTDGPSSLSRGVFGSSAWADGFFEVQDEGSQTIAAALEAKPGERILDACAGNGGKTLAVAAEMAGRGEICVFDVDCRRLAHLAANAERARVDALVTVVDAHSLGALEPASFDAVLIDAPCSSVGALRRTPSLRYSHDDPAASAEIQRGILTAAAPLVKPGGRLVYATCSVLSIENQCVARAFEREHDEFAPWPFEDAAATSPTVDARSHERLLLPHVHGTDGFFIARFVKRAT